jgi:integrase
MARAAPSIALRRSQKPSEATVLQDERRVVGSLWQDNGLVFPTTTGTTMSGTNLPGRYFKPLLKRAELLVVRLHDLRHTYATILLMAGNQPKYVQELLGHRNISINSRHLVSRHRDNGRWAWRRYGRVPLIGYCWRTAATGVYGLSSMAKISHI